MLVPRFFFDIHDDNNGLQRDNEGTELEDIKMVHRHAQSILPDIARDEIPGDGDRRMYTVLVTDQDGNPVYSATLAYTGMWLMR